MFRYEVKIMSHTELHLLQMAVTADFLVLAHMLTTQNYMEMRCIEYLLLRPKAGTSAF